MKKVNYNVMDCKVDDDLVKHYTTLHLDQARHQRRFQLDGLKEFVLTQCIIVTRQLFSAKTVFVGPEAGAP